MERLQNDILQEFLDNFIEELKRENSDRRYRDIKEFNIPFIIYPYQCIFKTIRGLDLALLPYTEQMPLLYSKLCHRTRLL